MRTGTKRHFSKSSLLISAAAAVLLSACSSSVERFSENPSDADPVYTASVPKEPESDIEPIADTGDVSGRPLGKVKRRAVAAAGDYEQPVYRQPRSARKTYAEETAEAAVYTKPAYKKKRPAPLPVETSEDLESQAAAEPAHVVAKSGKIRVEQGMTLYSIARTNGVSVARLAEANGIEPPYTVSTGQILRVPGVAAPRVPEATMAVKRKAVAEETDDYAEAPVRTRRKPMAVSEEPEETSEPPVKIKRAAAQGGGAIHTVKSGETLFALGRKYGLHPYAIADHNNLKHSTVLSLGQTVRIPKGGSKPAVVAEADEPVEEPVAAPVKKQKGKAVAETLPEPEDELPAPKLKKQKQVAEVEEETATPAEAAPSPPANANGLPALRWPVKGKVISAYGPKAGGLRNEGINLAVPEGTSVRAAESGVVAYAGNELKGYGNLVLVRHQGGWVTAYAHAKELFVKRGDTVKRGDVIAKAGQTGSVSSPQLHFEVRKGATAMDPMRFLNSATASN